MRKLRLKVVNPEHLDEQEVANVEKRTIEVTEGKKVILMTIKSDDISVEALAQVKQQFQEKVGSANATVIMVAIDTDTEIELYEEDGE